MYAVDFAPSGAYLVSVSGDRTAQVLDPLSGETRHRFVTSDGLTCVSISPDSLRIAAGGLDKCLYIWDVGSGAQVCRLNGFRDSIYGVRFSPDGAYLVGISLDKSVRVWATRDPITYKLLRSMELHKGSRHLNRFLFTQTKVAH